MSIEKRHLVTGALLAFVVLTGVTLAVKETRHARAVAAADAARPAEPVPSAATAETPANPALATPAETVPATEVTRALAAPVPAAAAAPSAATARPSPPAAKTPAPRPTPEPSTIYVTYFHTTARCASCLKIEDLTNATMTMRFGGPIAEKRIVWRLVNVDEPEHAHYVKDYGLFTKSVVVSEVKAGREVRWKNLDQVWPLLRDPEGFQAYVEREVRAYLEEA